MFTPPFTFEELEKEVRRLAEENPEFVYKGMEEEGSYPKCYYLTGTNDPPVGCIFGQAMSALLPDVSALQEADGNQWIISMVLQYLGVAPSDTQGRWVRAIQEYQDSRYAWGEAVAKADEIYSER